jgi:hypothetical protein
MPFDLNDRFFHTTPFFFEFWIRTSFRPWSAFFFFLVTCNIACIEAVTEVASFRDGWHTVVGLAFDNRWTRLTAKTVFTNVLGIRTLLFDYRHLGQILIFSQTLWGLIYSTRWFRRVNNNVFSSLRSDCLSPGEFGFFFFLFELYFTDRIWRLKLRWR